MKVSRGDAKRAIAGVQRAQQRLGRTTKTERIDMLKRLQSAVLARTGQLRDSTIDEYGAPTARTEWISQYALQCSANTAQALESCELTRHIGTATVIMEPVGVAVAAFPARQYQNAVAVGEHAIPAPQLLLTGAP